MRAVQLDVHTLSSAVSEVTSPAALLTTHQYIPSSELETSKIVKNGFYSGFNAGRNLYTCFSFS